MDSASLYTLSQDLLQAVKLSWIGRELERQSLPPLLFFLSGARRSTIRPCIVELDECSDSPLRFMVFVAEVAVEDRIEEIQDIA